ncbi:hypothetical protein Tco_0062493, partial [Tanacetum coccineum]
MFEDYFEQKSSDTTINSAVHPTHDQEDSPFTSLIMDANKKVELEHVQCPSESKILMNIIKNRSLRFSIAASASVPWIYMAQFWHTLKEDGSKNRLKRARDAYHNLQDDDIMKNIFNSGRNKNKVGMRIPTWMITDEMKLTKHYKMYAEVFGLDVPLTQSQPRSKIRRKFLHKFEIKSSAVRTRDQDDPHDDVHP